MLRICLAVMFCLSLISCEDKEDDKVFSAQSCLDHATASTVDTCVNMITGITSSRAYIIRCAADFKRNGVDTTTIVQAIEDIDNPSGNVSEGLLKKLVFKDGSNNPLTSRAEQAVDDCNATGSQTLMALAAAASTATFLQSLVGAGGDLANIDPNTLTDQQLIDAGEQALALYPTACTDGGPMHGTEACTDIETAATEAGVDLSQGTFTDAEKKALAQRYLVKI